MSLDQTPTDKRIQEVIDDQFRISNFTYVHSEMENQMENAKKQAAASDSQNTLNQQTSFGHFSADSEYMRTVTLDRDDAKVDR